MTANGLAARKGTSCRATPELVAPRPRCGDLIGGPRNDCSRRASVVHRPDAGALSPNRAGPADAPQMTPGMCPGGR